MKDIDGKDLDDGWYFFHVSGRNGEDCKMGYVSTYPFDRARPMVLFPENSGIACVLDEYGGMAVGEVIAVERVKFPPQRYFPSNDDS